MAILPFSRPRIGLNMDIRTIAVAEVDRPWLSGRGGRRLRACRALKLAPGLVRLSSTEGNVTDVIGLASQVRDLLNKTDRAIPVALVLPDLCSRMALFEFDALPKKASECEALVRWRFQKDQNISITDTRIAYRIFSKQKAATPHSDGVTARVLAVSVKNDILNQYEDVCQEAGITPISVGLASLYLFDFCRLSMVAMGSNIQECFFLSIGEGGFSFFAFRCGVPVFLRVKSLWNGDGDTVLSLQARVVNELRATLQFYDENAPKPRLTAQELLPSGRPLFIVDCNDWDEHYSGAVPPCEQHRELASKDDASYLLIADQAFAAALRVELICLRWNSLCSLQIGRVLGLTGILPPSGLPALAGVIA
jgi:hypothetical protein